MKPYTAFAFVIAPHLALAFEPDLPAGTRQLADEVQSPTHYELPVGVFQNGKTPTERVPGQVRTQSWKIERTKVSIQELGEKLSGQLTSDGYNIVFHCQAEDCGGFDFRFDTLVLPPPDMFVDLTDFHFISARRDTPKGAEAVGLILSHTSNSAMIQSVSVTPVGAVANTTPGANQPNPVTLKPVDASQTKAQENLTAQLLEYGHVVLEGLKFETGSSQLTDQSYVSLETLAQWLGDDGNRRIALVGHTDSEGALEPNVQLSKARAASVERHLINTYGVAAAQIEAHGIGYLAPITSNASSDGRDRNRRVEAILLSAP